jgi:hypothetical protein|tara:strand:- start:494 stop:799 length:306 start_codon:yes stop_codon:yes gene_type:complete
MFKEPNKHFLISGKKLNMIIMTLQMVSDKFPKIGSFNRFIQDLKDMRPYDDMLDEFIMGDQSKLPDNKKPIGERDSMTLDEMMADLQLRFMNKEDERDGED